MDIWVNQSDSNFNQLQLAITEFRVPSVAIPKEQFFSNDFGVFSFGKPPYVIEIMTAVKGLDFNYTCQQSTIELIDTFGINTKNS